ncbi:MAG: type II toxin-antitoxin system VapC family toxin [Treponema sp.]|nr:type II toxin-antitoxin system VapC family toxin [Treponema sp.]
MDILLDTHIILWALFNRENLSRKAIEVLSSEENNFFYSIASMWEIAIKHRKHPKQITRSGVEFMHYCEHMGFSRLPIDDRHICALETLEQKEGSPEHEDPFDRILLAQAKGDGMTLMTHDKKFLTYDEPYVFIV